jgi:hypothetical protein
VYTQNYGNHNKEHMDWTSQYSSWCAEGKKIALYCKQIDCNEAGIIAAETILQVKDYS